MEADVLSREKHERRLHGGGGHGRSGKKDVTLGTPYWEGKILGKLRVSQSKAIPSNVQCYFFFKKKFYFYNRDKIDNMV